MNEKLTDDERKIAEDNIKLMYAAMHHYRFDVEIFSGIAAMGYCRAIHAWCIRKNKNDRLSTYVYRCILHSCLNEMRKNNMQQRHFQLVAFDETYIQNSSYCDEISEVVEADLYFTSLLYLISDDEKYVVLNRIKGRSLRHIAREMGCSHERVRLLLKSAKVKADKVHNTI